MTSLINLSKTAKICLDKKSPTKISCQVKIILDASGSMNHLYNNGTVQNVVTRCLALALNIDKDRTMEVIAFDNNILDLGEATEHNYEDFIDPKFVMSRLGGGTSYSPALESLVLKKNSNTKQGFFKSLFSKKETLVEKNENKDPLFVMMITDGEASDDDDTRIAIKNLGSDVYIQFVGIGSVDFNFLQEAADDFDNCGFSKIVDIESISDESLYNTLVNEEFVSWYNKFITN